MRKYIRHVCFTGFLILSFLLLSGRLYASSLHFIAYGDTRRDIQTTEKPQIKHNAIAKVIRGQKPDFILFTGDMVYYNEFERFRDVLTRNYIVHNPIPFYPVIGNHELIFGKDVDILIGKLLQHLKAKQASGKNQEAAHLIKALKIDLHREIVSIPDSHLKIRSRQVLCDEICNRLDPGYTAYLKEAVCKKGRVQSWYSFTKETDGIEIKFIALNSSLPDDEDQFRWFLGELNGFPGPKIVFAHYPLYSIGYHGCVNLRDPESREWRFRARYAEFFNDTENNILLVINGHDHNYQRIQRTDEKGNIQTPVYLVSGGGGADLSGRGHCSISQLPMDDFYCQGLVTAYHFIDVTVEAAGKDELILKCRVPGLRYDLSEGLPDDATFERQFVKEHLELIDEFVLGWQNNSNLSYSNPKMKSDTMNQN